MFLFIVFTSLIPICITTALIIAEIFLMKKGKTKLGLILPIAVFVIATALSIPASKITEGSSGWDTSIVVYENDASMKDIGTLDILSDKDDNVVCFGRLRVEEGDAISYLELEFDDNGKLIGAGEAMNYKEALEYSLADCGFKGKLHGKSVDDDDFKRLSNSTTVNTETQYYELGTTLSTMAIFNIPTLILFVIYAVQRRKTKRRIQNSIDNTRIKDL